MSKIFFYCTQVIFLNTIFPQNYRKIESSLRSFEENSILITLKNPLDLTSSLEETMNICKEAIKLRSLESLELVVMISDSPETCIFLSTISEVFLRTTES